MNKNLMIGIAVALGLGLVAAVFFMVRQHAQMRELNELTEQLNYDKQLLAEEYTDFAVQFEGAEFNRAGNDSLVRLLDAEKQKVRSLLDELKAVKSTNLSRINELKAELASVRKVMLHYVVQIDSLNVLNQRLTSENTEIRRQRDEANQTVSSLSKERQTLTERVTLAARLEAQNITARPLNAKGKQTSKLNKIQQLEFCFRIGKNITAQAGEKTVYIRIQRPDNEVLVKSTANTFAFEGAQIVYSAKKNVEYGGEELPLCLYWDVAETLLAGTYRLDIFIDGNLIGQKSFTL